MTENGDINKGVTACESEALSSALNTDGEEVSTKPWKKKEPKPPKPPFEGEDGPLFEKSENEEDGRTPTQLLHEVALKTGLTVLDAYKDDGAPANIKKFKCILTMVQQQPPCGTFGGYAHTKKMAKHVAAISIFRSLNYNKKDAYEGKPFNIDWGNATMDANGPKIVVVTNEQLTLPYYDGERLQSKGPTEPHWKAVLFVFVDGNNEKYEEPTNTDPTGEGESHRPKFTCSVSIVDKKSNETLTVSAIDFSSKKKIKNLAYKLMCEKVAEREGITLDKMLDIFNKFNENEDDNVP